MICTPRRTSKDIDKATNVRRRQCHSSTQCCSDSAQEMAGYDTSATALKHKDVRLYDRNMIKNLYLLCRLMGHDSELYFLFAKTSNVLC